VEERLLREALKKFYWIRSLDGLRKRPSTSELIDWIKVLMVGGIPPEMVKKELPFLGILIKQERDYELVQRHANLGGRRFPLRERYASIY